MRFREHRGSLADSMETVVSFDQGRDALIRYCQLLLKPYGYEFDSSQFHVEPYGSPDGRAFRDSRVDPPWDTHLVTIDGYGVMGFTDGPC